ncbi:MAG: hypothetical protein Ct9H300mP13_8210 [Gammaproteobacteria bacterium]|nr:MAG: hypothetical protein Ct9H300mP13_8210 [Gammaproteobacteria bacterium]
MIICHRFHASRLITRANNRCPTIDDLGVRVGLLGDVVIDVPPDSQVHRQVVRKRAEVHDMDINPLVRLCFIEVTEPNMQDPSGDLRRVRGGDRIRMGVNGPCHRSNSCRGIADFLRLGEWKVTVAVFDGHEVIAIWPGFKDRVMGLAVDVVRPPLPHIFVIWPAGMCWLHQE